MRQYERSVRNIQKLIVASILLTLVIGCARLDLLGSNNPVWTGALVTHSIVEDNGILEELWSRSNVFASQHESALRMAAAEGSLFVLGSLEQTEDETVLAFDGTDGSLLWHGTDRNSTTLYATSSALYVGYGGFGTVIAHDLHTGESYWSQRLPDARSILHIYMIENMLHVSSHPDIFHLIQADTGEVIQTIEYEFGRRIFVSTDEMTFVQYPTLATLQAVETQSNALIWEANVGQEYLQGPIFTEELIFVRTERRLGRVYAIDRQTGDILWQTERNVVSNVATTKTAAYLLAENGELLRLDSRNGEATTLLRFEPNPFILIDSEGHPKGYYIAIDEDAGLVYTLLGDSRQLFAFRITDFSNN